MKIVRELHEWVTPITIGAFALSAVTGIMLFFKVQLGLVKPIHEWLSWLLVIGTIFHGIVNRQLFMKYISKPVGRGILIFFFLLICISMLPLGNRQKHPLAKVSDAVIQSPLWKVEQIANQEQGEAMNILKSKGISVERRDQTIKEIAASNRTSPLHILMQFSDEIKQSISGVIPYMMAILY